MPLRHFILLAIACVTATAFCEQEPLNRSSKYAYGLAGRSQSILGSEDERVGFGFGVAWGKPEPRFGRGSVLAQLVSDVYFDQTSSQDRFDSTKSHTFAFGNLWYGRWFWPQDKEHRGFYADLGWGAQYANLITHDLDSHLNSTPMLGVGSRFPMGDRDFMIGLRYLHISNGGTYKPNRGQNQIYFMIGVRF